MAQPASEVFKYLVSESLQRNLADAVGWSFAIWRDGKEFLSLYDGFARAPWEPTVAPLPMSPDTRFQTGSMSKMINGWGLMLAIRDWNLVLAKAQDYYTRVLRPKLSANDRMTIWPADVAAALPMIQIPYKDELRNSVAQQTGLPLAVVDRVFQQPITLSLDTKLVELLKRHLSGVKFGTNVEKITLRHCLTHTTHIDWKTAPSDGYDAAKDVGANWTETGKNVAYLRDLLSRALKSEPGTDHYYDNNNSCLVRFAIEECIAGERPEAYEYFIRSRAFVPLSIYNINCAVPGEVFYYGQSRRAPANWYGTGTPSTRTAAANGWFASSRDLARWLDAVARYALGKEWLTREVFVVPTKTGWFPQDSSPATGLPVGVIAHNGSGSGLTAMMGVLPNNMTAALLVNSESKIAADTAFVRAFAAAQPVINFPPQYVQAQVTIKNPLESGQVWYTLDGSDPVPNRAGSILYTDAGITRLNNMRVRAGVWENGAQLTGPVEAWGGAFDANELRPSFGAVLTKAGGIRWRYVTGVFSTLSEVDGFQQEGILHYNQNDTSPGANSFTTSFVLPKSPGFPTITQDWYYAMEFTGYINIPDDGVYTFSTKSDDGSRLWIGGTLLVDNDGLHGPKLEGSPKIRLRKGLHPITIEFMQGLGTQELEVKWSGVTLQSMPAVTEEILPFQRLYYSL